MMCKADQAVAESLTLTVVSTVWYVTLTQSDSRPQATAAMQ